MAPLPKYYDYEVEIQHIWEETTSNLCIFAKSKREAVKLVEEALLCAQRQGELIHWVTTGKAKFVREVEWKVKNDNGRLSLYRV
jgi:hypothetical protein